MSKEVEKDSKKKEHVIEWIDVNNEGLMVSLGIRPRDYGGRDSSVWTKTAKEKARLRKLRRVCKTPEGRWAAPERKGFKQRLIVNVFDKKNKLTNKAHTTFSHECAPEDLYYILCKYNTRTVSIVRAFYGGKELDISFFNEDN